MALTYLLVLTWISVKIKYIKISNKFFKLKKFLKSPFLAIFKNIFVSAFICRCLFHKLNFYRFLLELRIFLLRSIDFRNLNILNNFQFLGVKLEVTEKLQGMLIKRLFPDVLLYRYTYRYLNILNNFQFLGVKLEVTEKLQGMLIKRLFPDVLLYRYTYIHCM